MQISFLQGYGMSFQFGSCQRHELAGLPIGQAGSNFSNEEG